MKKLRVFLYSIILSIVCIIGLNAFYDNQIHNEYFDNIGNYLDPQKNQGLALQSEAVKKGDNVFIYGSSELSASGHPFHPRAFFRDKDRGFQVNLIGTGHCQSLIHGINFGALGSQLKGQKVVFIISPQWFDAVGETTDGFQGNFSELQFLKFMLTNNIDKDIKRQVASRVLELTASNNDFYDIDLYCRLYKKNNIISKSILYTLIPYYKGKEYILSLKDKRKSISVLKNWRQATLKSYERPTEKIEPSTNINWEKIKLESEEYAKIRANNNKFLIENDYYNKYVNNKLEKLKGVYYKGVSYDKSPEYDDLKLLLSICKSQGIKPLFISVPVNGKWYDYGGFSKEDREEYYSNVKKIISSYNYDFEDLSKYEYEDYFLKDIMHLGWKGWVYVDESIDKYYRSNK